MKRKDIFNTSWPGVVQKADKLLLFGWNSITVVRIWDKPAAWRKSKRHPAWHGCRPELDLNLWYLRLRVSETTCKRTNPQFLDDPFLSANDESQVETLALLRKRKAELQICERYYAQIPDAVREPVSKFAEGHFSLLSFCARCPGGLDLLHSNPAAAFMLAHGHLFGKKVCRPLRSARALLRHKQQELIAWLGFEDVSQSSVNMLRKVPPEHCRIKSLQSLRTLMKNPRARETLQVLPRITGDVMDIMSQPSICDIVTPRFLFELSMVSDDSVDPRIPYLLRNLSDYRQLSGEAIKIEKLSSLTKRNGRLAELLHHLHYRITLQHLTKEFPPPPLEGSALIQPIQTRLALFQEGVKQRHCIERYVRRIEDGWAYAYHIETEAEQGTVLISPYGPPGRPEGWKLVESLGKANGPLRPETHRHLMDWLAARCGKHRWLPANWLGGDGPELLNPYLNQESPY